MPTLTANMIARGLQAHQVPTTKVVEPNRQTDGEIVVSDRVTVQLSFATGTHVRVRMVNDMPTYSGPLQTVSQTLEEVYKAIKQVPMSIEDRLRWHLFKHYKRKHVLVIHNYNEFFEGLTNIAGEEELMEMDYFIKEIGPSDTCKSLPNPSGTDPKTFLIFNFHDPVAAVQHHDKFKQRLDVPDVSVWSHAQLVCSTMFRYPWRK